MLAAPAQAWIPNDPGMSGVPGGWQSDQWNFMPGTGVDAPRAWDNLIAAGKPGGRGVKIAVLDSGVSYDRSPDLSSIHFVRGYDYCARTGSGELACAGEDNKPEDDYGHGTHVASTIAETTNNAKGLTGLAYGATIIPVKVLNRYGDGDEESIAAGLRFAADQGAQIINLSFEFGSSTTSASEIPKIAAAVRYARRKGALIVAAAGNIAFDRVAFPAALPGVVSVGAVTEHGCLAEYSNTGSGPGPGRARRRRGRRADRPAGVPARRTRRPLDPPARLHAQEPHLPLPDELRRHVDGGAARLRDRGADHRLRRDRLQADAGRDRAAPEGHRARPRRAGQGPPVRRRDDRRGRGDRALAGGGENVGDGDRREADVRCARRSRSASDLARAGRRRRPGP